jgi:hypothetical protein
VARSAGTGERSTGAWRSSAACGSRRASAGAGSGAPSGRRWRRSCGGGAPLGFLRHQGFRELDRAWELRLELAAAVGSEADAAALAGQGIAITTLADEGPGDPAVLRRAWELHNASRRDQPPAEEHAEPIPFDAWVARMVEGPDASADGFLLAKAGDAYVGMTTLDRLTSRTRSATASRGCCRRTAAAGSRGRAPGAAARS